MTDPKAIEGLIERLRDLAKKAKYRHSDADVAMTDAADAFESLQGQLAEKEKGQELLRASLLTVLDRAERAEREAAELRAALARTETIVRVYYAPWGAGKAAEWEALSNDGAFDASTAMRLIQTALASRKGEA